MVPRFTLQKTILILVCLSLLLVLAACTTQQPLSESVSPGSAETPGTTHGPGEIARIEVVVISLMAVATAVNLVTNRLRIPYTIGLVLIGLALSLFVRTSEASISPEIILSLLLPPLVFEAAYHVRFKDLERELSQVLTLAIPGVILTMALIGVVIWLGSGMALHYALVFGALIAPTDPVAVVGLFRSLGAPRRLVTLMEGESLLNDGTAIVIFKLMLTFALTGQFDLTRGVLQFFLIAGGGLAVGAITGLLVSLLMRVIDNHVVETTLTTVLAYGTYLLAEYSIGVSGVLAVVAAGLATHWTGQRNMSPGTQITVFDFWEYAAFLANSFVFLLIGLQADLDLLLENIPAILWSILAVLIARGIIVYILLPLVHREIPPAWKGILFWGGLRGAISLALVLSLRINFELRDQLLAMAFGVVLFTLLVQGLTLTPIIQRSGIIQVDEVHQEYERHHARTAALRAASKRLKGLFQEGSISEYTHDRLHPILEGRLNQVVEAERAALEREPDLRQEALEEAWKEVLRAQRSALTKLYQEKAISEAVYLELAAELDKALLNPGNGGA